MNFHASPEDLMRSAELNFLWLELTNRCNLECVHCYAKSSPSWVDVNPLSVEEYKSILDEAYKAGCRAVQFIGGEPTIHKGLPDLLKHAKDTGFGHVEVYSNLISLPEHLVEVFKETGTKLATSVYSADPAVHDAITTRPGSFDRTAANLKRLISAYIPVRASFIAMDENRDHFERTRHWLIKKGVESIGFDEARSFGRASSDKVCTMGELCGECAKGTLCVDPEGGVSPCIMSKPWGVGDLNTSSLGEILASNRLQHVRSEIFRQTNHKEPATMGGCNPSRPNPCGPDSGPLCSPCSPNGHCGPNKCQPN